MTFIHKHFGKDHLLRKEKIAIALFIVLIACFMLFDVFDDWYEGLSLYHIFPEIIIATLGMGSALYLFTSFAHHRHIALNKTRDELDKAKRLASEWQNEVSVYRHGLTEAICLQLKKWGMTDAEQEICFLLLKGFSLQEIADLRNTSERTVRQQASVIYKKSGLTGRIQLSAFFLEDLLPPV